VDSDTQSTNQQQRQQKTEQHTDGGVHQLGVILPHDR
jgi:hypothetical protein